MLRLAVQSIKIALSEVEQAGHALQILKLCTSGKVLKPCSGRSDGADPPLYLTVAPLTFSNVSRCKGVLTHHGVGEQEQG